MFLQQIQDNLSADLGMSEPALPFRYEFGNFANVMPHAGDENLLNEERESAVMTIVLLVQISQILRDVQ